MKISSRRIFVVQLCIVVSLRAAVDGPIEEPMDLLQVQAAAGDPRSQYNLALHLGSGDRITKDAAASVQWYRRAALAGFPSAQYNLGVLYANGTEVPRDEKEAAKWLYAAAQNGVFDAQKILIEWYIAGRGVEKSPAKALAWDMIARRTIELQHGVKVDLPPKPGSVRTDGAAEMKDAAGNTKWVHPDGGVETVDAEGVRRIQHKDGRAVTIQKDGTQLTRFPNDVTEEIAPGGRKTLRDGKGNVQIHEPDGTRIEEGDATASDGSKARVVDRYDKDGKRVSHRVTQGDSTYEQRDDGTGISETKYKTDNGLDVILIEDIGADRKMSNGRLVRAENRESPTGMEIWSIRRTLRLGGGNMVDVIEQYSSAGFYSQEEVPGTRRAVMRAATESVAVREILSNPGIRIVVPPEPKNLPVAVEFNRGGRRSSMDDPTAFRPEPDLAPMLGALRELEAKSRNFAGATAADYDRARASAQAYLFPLPNPPQKATGASGWMLEKMLTKTTLHEVPMTPIPDDRSRLVPFGVHGRSAIKLQPWKHAESAHFIVHFVQEADARLAMQYIEGAFTMVTSLLQLDTARATAKSHVFIFPDAAAWRGFREMSGLPATVAGFAFKTELLFGVPDDKVGREASIKTLCHEVTHAIVARYYTTRKLPLWLNEGMADYIAARTIATKRAQPVEKYLRKNPGEVVDVPRILDRISYGSATTPDRLEIFYAHSERCVRTILEKLPIVAFPRLVNALAAGNHPQHAFPAAYGKHCDGIPALQSLISAP